MDKYVQNLIDQGADQVLIAKLSDRAYDKPKTVKKPKTDDAPAKKPSKPRKAK